MSAGFLAAVAPPEWAHRAACLGLDPTLFHPEVGRSHDAAKAVCRRCPVKDACLDHAIRNGERFGVWGGTSENERHGLRRQWADAEGLDLRAEAKRMPIVHGDIRRGARRCYQRPEGACDLCRDAYSRWLEYATDDGEGAA